MGANEVVRGSSQAALTALQANGLSFNQALVLLSKAHEVRDRAVPGNGVRLTSHADGTYTVKVK